MSKALHPMLVRTLLVALALISSRAAMTAQVVDDAAFEAISGTSYVVAFPDTTQNTFDQRYPDRRFDDRLFIVVYSAVANTASISGLSYQRDAVVLKAGGFTVIDLMGIDGGPRAPRPFVTDHCRPAANTFRIEAVHPVVVYQYAMTKFGAEAWTALPVDAWGVDHFVAAHPGEIGSDVSPGGEFDYNRQNKMFSAEILVIAAYDDTRVTIIPRAQVHNFCATVAITLQAGEAYQIQSFVDTNTVHVGVEQPDFAGSRITSSKPVGVISGNTRAQLIDDGVGLAKNSFKNMLIEWIAPTRMHGQEFVFLPTIDAQTPLGTPSEDVSEKRKAEFVRVYATSDDTTTGTITDWIGVRAFDRPMVQGEFFEARISASPGSAAVFRTSRPAQVMMAAPAVTKYAGTTSGSDGYIGAAYDSWGGFMVTMTPRERWASFAPFYAPLHPTGMNHAIVVATDSLHRNDVIMENGRPFLFDRRVPGTDIVWGSMTVQAGVDHWLTGRNGARFYGCVHGTYSKGGHEEYRPGRARNGDDPPAGVNGVDAGSAVLHPSEYEEALAVAYAYPLAAMLDVMGRADSLRIESNTNACGDMTTRITLMNPDPSGIRSMRLDDNVNAKIRSINPFPLTGATQATVVVAPVNGQLAASATLVVKDHTGNITRIPYAFVPEELAVPAGVDFGLVVVDSVETMTVVVSNTGGVDATIRSIRLLDGTVFSLSNAPTLPLTLMRNAVLSLDVDVLAPDRRRDYVDTVEVMLGCSRYKIPLSASTNGPCVNVSDLAFGTLRLGERKTLPLRICNDGGGEVTFDANAIEWLANRFTISASDIAQLSAAVLERGECITIMVSAHGDSIGTFTTVAHLNASTRECRDSSIWSVQVTGQTAAPFEAGAINSLAASEPNPFTTSTSITFTLARPGHASLVVYDMRGERVATLVDGERDAGAHTVTFDASGLPPGAYHYRLSVGSWSQTRTMLRR